MVTIIEMTTGRLIYRSPSADPMAVTAPPSNPIPLHPTLQLLPVEAVKTAPAMPPELAQASLDAFLGRWAK